METLVQLDDWSSYVYFYPHFHLLGVGEKGGRTFAEGSDSDKFLFKGISELGSPEAILKSSMYLLSHTCAFVGLEKQVHALRWFGEMAPCNWSLKKASEGVRTKVNLKVSDLVHSFGEEEGVGS